jgi:hypothetical protein
VLDLGLSKLKLYYAFMEDSNSPCANALSCGAVVLSDTTGTSINANACQMAGAVKVAGVDDNLSCLVDGNLNTAMTIVNTVANGCSLVKANVTGWKEFLQGSDLWKNDKCLSGYLSYAPQLFYGECHTAMGNRVVHFREQQSNGEIISNSPLTGVLYRGMARVEMTLSIDKRPLYPRLGIVQTLWCAHCRLRFKMNVVAAKQVSTHHLRLGHTEHRVTHRLRGNDHICTTIG